jgi:hypothetical protein
MKPRGYARERKEKKGEALSLSFFFPLLLIHHSYFPQGNRLTNRKILPLSGKIFFITAESAESAEKKLYNKKKHLCVLRVLCGE